MNYGTRSVSLLFPSLITHVTSGHLATPPSESLVAQFGTLKDYDVKRRSVLEPINMAAMDTNKLQGGDWPNHHTRPARTLLATRQSAQFQNAFAPRQVALNTRPWSKEEYCFQSPPLTPPMYPRYDDLAGTALCNVIYINDGHSVSTPSLCERLRCTY